MRSPVYAEEAPHLDRWGASLVSCRKPRRSSGCTPAGTFADHARGRGVSSDPLNGLRGPGEEYVVPDLGDAELVADTFRLGGRVAWVLGLEGEQVGGRHGVEFAVNL